MTGYNMPPGCNPSDIPGNDARDPTPEEDRVYDLLEKLTGNEGQSPKELDAQKDEILQILSDLVDKLDREHNQRLNLENIISTIRANFPIKDLQDMITEME
jgi:hypothetical protein